MEITEIRVKLVNDATDRLKAYCSITVDGCFVVRDLKVIDGTSGLFVAMPSRKLAARCVSCGSKNHLRARYCSECGKQLTETRTYKASGRSKLHADVAHPINAECREFIQSRVIEAYEEELERSKQPDYVASDYDEDNDDDVDTHESSPYSEIIEELKADGAAVRRERSASSGRPLREEADGPDEQNEPVAQPAPAATEAATAASKSGQAEANDKDTFGAGLV